MPRYRVVESVGSARQSVTRWSDLEHHHPSSSLRESGRVYARINGQPEEVASDYRGTAVYTPGGEVMVSKDMILLDASSASAHVSVPSPASGVVGAVNRANGTVEILDRQGGELMFRLRHMRIDDGISPGVEVQYGQSLGTQSGYGRGNPSHYRPHLHMDANARYLDQADRYVRDMASGVITQSGRPQSVANLINDPPTVEPIRGRFPAPPVQALANGRIEPGERGPDVALLQEKLRAAGARDAQGRELGQDGHYGVSTQYAVVEFQEVQGLPKTGVADGPTLTRLGIATTTTMTRVGTVQMLDANNRDQALLENLSRSVHALDKQTGKDWDESSERLCASAFVMAKRCGFTADDDLRLSLNQQTDQHAAGELLHLSRHGLNASPNPAANRTHIAVVEALSLSCHDRMQQALDSDRVQSRHAEAQESQRFVQPLQIDALAVR